MDRKCQIKHASEHGTVRLKATMAIVNTDMTVYASDIGMSWGTFLISRMDELVAFQQHQPSSERIIVKTQVNDLKSELSFNLINLNCSVFSLRVCAFYMCVCVRARVHCTCLLMQLLYACICVHS